MPKKGTHIRWRCADCGRRYVNLPKSLDEFGRLRPIMKCLRDAPENEQYLADGYRVSCFGELKKIGQPDAQGSYV
jgi:hypothetical protein